MTTIQAMEAEWSKPIPPNDEKAAFATKERILKLFEKSRDNSLGMHDSFRNSIDLIYYTLRRDEEKFSDLAKRMAPNSFQLTGQILAEMVHAFCVEYVFEDYLGYAFQLLNLNGGLGQNFTPFNVGLMMAKMMMHVKEEIASAKAENRKVTVLDPCVGSGCLLLAGKRAVMEEVGLEGLDWYQFSGQDIDPLCCRMAEIQMLLTDYKYMRDLIIVDLYEARVKQI